MNYEKSPVPMYPHRYRGITDCRQSLAEFFRRSEKINLIVFCGDLCVAENTSHGMSVEMYAVGAH